MAANIYATLALFAGCAVLPKHIDRPSTQAIVAAIDTPLGRLASPPKPLESGFVLFNTGDEALQARVALAEAAHASIDAQYFEWAGDTIGRAGLAPVIAAADRGVRVRLLIDDHNAMVNAAYSKSRLALTDVQVGLYEMKPFAASRALYVARAQSSGAHLALHGKAAVFDRKTVFLGSFNLDPRSAFLDTEEVFVIESPELAAQLLTAFAVDFLPANAWQIGSVVGRSESSWITASGSHVEVEPHEPAGAWRRFLRTLAKLLPIRRYL